MQRSTRTDRRRGVLAAVIASTLLLAAGCGTDDPDDDATGASTIPPTATTGDTGPAHGHDDPDAPHFAYEGELGPERWGELGPEHATCAVGTEQSPIDLTGADPAGSGGSGDPAGLVVAYGEGPSTIVHNGHTVEVAHGGDSTIVLDGTTYEVVQFHLHHGSEHLVDGTPHAMELHILHAAGDELAVVGVLVDVGEENAALAPLLDDVPADGDPPIEDVPIDLAAVLPDDRSAYRYHGSLTTPPCTEGVRWLVLDTPIQVSREQFDRFTAVVAPNARPVQPRNDRPLVHDDT